MLQSKPWIYCTTELWDVQITFVLWNVFFICIYIADKFKYVCKHEHVICKNTTEINHNCSIAICLYNNHSSCIYSMIFLKDICFYWCQIWYTFWLCMFNWIRVAIKTVMTVLGLFTLSPYLLNAWFRSICFWI